jgi:hypothetical protein
MAHLHDMRVIGWMFGTIKLLFRRMNSSLSNSRSRCTDPSNAARCRLRSGRCASPGRPPRRVRNSIAEGNVALPN